MVGSLVRRAPVTAAPETPTSAAAERMAAERVSSLLVPMRDGWGIVTDRDLRTRIVAARADLGTPLEVIATFPVRTLPHDTLAGEALLRMFAQGVHHFPVTGPTGEVLGVVTDTDLMGLGRHTPFAIEERDRAGEHERGRWPPPVANSPTSSWRWCDANADPIDVGRVVALVVDAMTERLIALAVDDLGDPPCAWAWLALGSAARHEQALHTDQDHALVYDPVQGEADAEPYFAELAERVTSGLEAAGIPRCEGDAMAVHPTLRRSARRVRRGASSRWMDSAGPPCDRAFVDRVRLPPGRGSTRRRARPRRRDPRWPVPALRSFGRWPAGRLDLKPADRVPARSRGGRQGRARGPARRQARRHHDREQPRRASGRSRPGVTTKDTLGRLRCRRGRGLDRHTVATELIEAFHFLWEVRLHPPGAAGRRPARRPTISSTRRRSARSRRQRPEGGLPRDRAAAQRWLATEEGVSQAGDDRRLSRSRGRCPSRGTRRRRGSSRR